MFTIRIYREALAASILAVSLMAVGGVPSRAGTIYYEAIDLANPVPGDDTWLYRYYVTGFSFAANQGFSIFFDWTRFTALEDPPPPVNADWDVIALQPDPGLPDDGLYDALALVNGAPLADPFTVSFVFLGPVPPGSQPFTVNQFDGAGNLTDILDTGYTVPLGQIPEPPVVILVASGLIQIMASRRRRQRRGEK